MSDSKSLKNFCLQDQRWLLLEEEGRDQLLRLEVLRSEWDHEVEVGGRYVERNAVEGEEENLFSD